MDIGDPERVIQVEPEPMHRPTEVPGDPGKIPAPEPERRPVPARR